MDVRKYLMQQKLKKDKETFKEKLHLSIDIDFFTNQIKSLSSQITELKTKKNISTKHQENKVGLLKSYIEELNLKMYPDSFKKSFANENIRLHVSNLKLLSNLQDMKNNMLSDDKKTLEDNSKDIVYYIDQVRRNKIKQQIKQDFYSLEFYKIKRKEFEEINGIIPELLNKIEKFKIFLRHNKFLYEQILKQNKILEKMLEKQRKIYYELKNEEKIFQNNDGKKINSEDICKRSNDKKIFENIRSLSEENFQFINYNCKNYYEKHIEDKNNNKSKVIQSLLLSSPKFIGYKSEKSFLKRNKMENRKIIKHYKPINPYNFLNIFSINKRYDSLGEFIDNFSSINSKFIFKIIFIKMLIFNCKKLSFYTLNSDKTTTKMNTISSDFSSKTKKHKNKLFSSKFNSKKDSNKILIFIDYINGLISQQKSLTKYITNKISEEIRTNNQIKTFISECINDINIELFEIKKNNKNEKIKENMIKYNEKLLYILSYIFDNCLSGIKTNHKILINKSRNKIDTKLKNTFFHSNETKMIKLKKSFSLNDIKFKSI